MGYKKTILKTTLFTLLSLVIVVAILFCIMFWGCTASFGDFMYNVGCEEFASNLYIRAYEKNNEIIDCYKALNIKIKLGESKEIIELYEDFISDEEYSAFISDYKTKNEKLDINILEKSAILNEENYLTNAYLKALIDENREEDAFKKAREKFSEYEKFTLNDQGVYALGLFKSNGSLYSITYEGFDEQLISEMQNYFDKSIEIFESNKGSEDNLTKSYLVALGNRIINLGQDINSIYTSLNKGEDVISTNLEKMIAVNEGIKGLI